MSISNLFDGYKAPDYDLFVNSITANTVVSGSISFGNIDISGNTISSTNTNGDINLSPDGTGSVNVTTDLNVDNINIDGNVISSTNTNGNIFITPDGTGLVNIGNQLQVDNLSLNGNTISSLDTNGDINLTPDGTGSVVTDNITLNGNTISTSSGNLILDSNSDIIEVGVTDVVRDVDNDSIIIKGGTTAGDTKLEIFGENHPTEADNILLKGNTVKLVDSVDNTLFQAEGGLIRSGTPLFDRTVDNSALSLYGGTAANSLAVLILTGNSNTSPNQFIIQSLETIFRDTSQNEVGRIDSNGFAFDTDTFVVDSGNSSVVIGDTSNASYKFRVVDDNSSDIVNIYSNGSATTGAQNNLILGANTSGTPNDTFGPSILFEIDGNDTTNQNMGDITVTRRGGVNTSQMRFDTYVTGTKYESLNLTHNAINTVLTFPDGIPTSGTGNSVNINSSNELFENTSSLRFKKDIDYNFDAFNTISQLKPCLYRYKDKIVIDEDGNEKIFTHPLKYGLVAEDVDLIDKKLVNYEKDEKTPRGIDYMQIVPLLVSEIQRLNNEVEQLKTKINQ